MTFATALLGFFIAKPEIYTEWKGLSQCFSPLSGCRGVFQGRRHPTWQRSSRGEFLGTVDRFSIRPEGRLYLPVLRKPGAAGNVKPSYSPDSLFS